MIFDNHSKKKTRTLGVSFDKNLEVYDSCKTCRPIKKYKSRKKKLQPPINNREFEVLQTVAKNNSNDESVEKEISSGTFSRAIDNKETVSILIHNNENPDLLDKACEIESPIVSTAYKEKMRDYNHPSEIKINGNQPKLQNKATVLGLLFKKQEEFNVTSGKLTDQAKKRSALGGNMDDIIDIFAETAQEQVNSTNQKNYNLVIDNTENKQNDGSNIGHILLQRVHHENKNDFLNYMIEEYSKLHNKNMSQHNLDTSNNLPTMNNECEPIFVKEELSDEENNHTVYCEDVNFEFQVENEQGLISPVNMNRPKSPLSATKSVRNTKKDTSDKILEFRRKEAKRQSEIDIMKFKKESTRSENLIPVEKGLFSDIIYFDEKRKSIINDKLIDHAKKAGSLKLCNESLIEVADKSWSLSSKEDKLSPESSEGPDKWRSVLQTIVNLNLRFNKLKPMSLTDVSVCSIKELRLSNNQIEELPSEIGELQFLSYLNLSYNRLRTLPLKFCSLKNLEEINLRRNFIERLPDTFGNLINLQKANLSFNKMIKIPTSFVCLSCLTTLDLSFNKLIQLPTRLMYLKKLEHADISYNYLSELPPMVDMRHLTFFDSTCNRLRRFPNFSGCIRLTELRLGINQIKEIVMENLCRCPLVHFMLPYNKVEVIPDDISQLTRLEILDISNNLILMLPWTLAKLQHLSYVKINNNKIANMKKSALEDTPQSVLEILRNRLILYEGKDSPILKEIAEEEKKKMKERKGWDTQEENAELSPNEKKKMYKKGGKITAKVDKEEDEKFIDIVNNYELDSDVNKLLNNVLKTLPKSNKIEFKKSLIAQRSLICKEMNLSDLSVNLMKVARHYKVFKVDLSKNNLRFVPIRLKDLFNHLREISLSNNNLKTIPEFFGSMIQLRTLDVSHNQLDSFPLSMNDCNIVSLNAMNNCFTKIPKVLYSMYNLEHVNFSKNKIKTIDVYGIKNWKRLSYLNMRSNLIEEVPCELGFLMNIRTLDLSDNLFKDPSPQVIKSGTGNILKHLRYISFKQAHGDLKNMVLF